ncbi:dipeptide/oligopeptide/nickel ABC transporter permease/ATP-binding protein [Microbacterium sp. STN6]|uniref:dipeptide/oligopeptide/nickel ABC transporter permease/ATP-binding protein n=1 Tax=Microbacterium sp. STN6 TaxID=2995588 RepID=UPI00226101B0|nr:dipeptide/oligopeptide/nickel ABC transporter permease/ATP-binding protein [Microbacterium sp. STN6]MCX7521805.1 dipeptide/oligopeptide/nickel ABC transporter permease/ATP-binding protein [Microbacterium sp. STN6]
MSEPTIKTENAMDADALAGAGVTAEPARPGVLRRLVGNPLGLIALIILAIVVVSGIIGPWVAPFDPNHASLADALKGPGGAHLLGTDSAGRDVFSRLLVGARSTLIAAALAAAVALVVGVPSGLIAGFFGGWFDSIASWCTNVLMSLPAIIILLAASAALGHSVWVSMTIFGVLISTGFFRLTRTSVQAVRSELYVDAARVAGLSNTSIIGKHILFVVRAPLIIQTSMVCGIAISIQATLEFLGLGDVLVPTWGVMLNEGFINIYTSPILAVWPGIAISLTIGAFVVLGNALRDALEDTPKAAKKRAAAGPSRVSLLDDDETRGVALVKSNHLLEVNGLGVGYPQPSGRVKTVVTDVSLHLDRGEVLGIVGESGSGKTQTAFSILGLLPDEAVITGGSIVFDGTPLVSSSGGRLSQGRLAALRGKRIAYIPQEPMSNLDPNFTIGYQLVRPLVKVLGLSKADARARALELLGIVGITNPQRTFDAYPHEVSGGMAQRVLIAGAVSCNPDLLIADEPTTALDVTVQAEVLDLLRDLQDRFTMGVVLVTHNFGVVADLCDRVVVMQNGRLVESGDVRSILRDPRDAYTKTLLGAMLEGKTPMTMLTAGPDPLDDEMRMKASI